MKKRHNYLSKSHSNTKIFKGTPLLVFMLYKNIVILVILIDQLTKHLVEQHIYRPLKVLPFLNITKVHNFGVTFGLFQYYSKYLLIALLSIILCYVVYLFRNTNAKIEKTAFALIISGALGNLWDRITLGFVVDFLDFHAFGIHYWTFNIADSAIVVGLMLVLYYQILHTSKR